MLKIGMVVQIKYILFDESDNLLDKEDNLEFVFGIDEILLETVPFIENMKIGGKKDFVIVQNEGYGAKTNDLIVKIPKNEVENFSKYELNDIISMFDEDSPLFGKVIDKSTNFLTVDFNHQYAGKDLYYSVEILDIRNATSSEKEYGIINRNLKEFLRKKLNGK